MCRENAGAEKSKLGTRDNMKNILFHTTTISSWSTLRMSQYTYIEAHVLLERGEGRKREQAKGTFCPGPGLFLRALEKEKNEKLGGLVGAWCTDLILRLAFL